MRQSFSALALSLLLGACVERVDLGVPEPEDVADMGVDVGPDLGPDIGPDMEPDEGVLPDMGVPDQPVPPECAELDRPACEERPDCDWYGGDGGFCADAGLCDDYDAHRACVTDRNCDWEGEAGGRCIPTVADPTDCSDLWELHCRETLGCVWDGGEFGECHGDPIPGCHGLSMAMCDAYEGRCRWYDGVVGFCADAVPCWGQEWALCITKSSCDWHAALDGLCVPAEGEPGGCDELPSDQMCREYGCVWEGEPGECFGTTPVPSPECEVLNHDFCMEDARCDWYGPEVGGFCDRVTVCDEFESHGLCVERPACDWEGEALGYCRPAATEPTACSGAGFLHCRNEAPDCEWRGGDWGECFDAR